MNRVLEIALVAAALSLAMGYVLHLQLRAGAFLGASRRDQAGLFWSLMIVLALAEAGFVGLAVTSLAGWLSGRV